MKRTIVLAVGILLAFGATLTLAQSQDARGMIVGRVTDSTGAVVPDTDDALRVAVGF